MPQFKVHSPYQPSGDQPEAIEKLAQGVENGLDEQVLLGVTGSGKTFTMAKVIEQVQRPTLVLAHNKTLAAQLCSEFKEFFPENAVEYFVSYYDYYQPEAYIPHTDTYIAKDAATNEEIDRLRLSATFALLERRDVIVVASVSCIYGLGEPEDFAKMAVSLRAGAEYDRDQVLKRLVECRYERNDIAFERNMFRVRGDTVEVFPAYYKDRAVRIEFFGDEIDRISEFDPITGVAEKTLSHIVIYPASHYVTTQDKMDRAVVEIRRELEDQVREFEANGQLVEAQRIRQRTEYDIEMMQELGYCTGIENYSRVISGRPVGSAPMTLLDFFPKDFLLFVDESHVTLPQVRAMYNGDHARKDSLVKYGFRLPCAYDNRPLKFEEFEQRVNQAIYVSATPAEYERTRAGQIVEQVIRPTGLLDPVVEVRPVEGQIDDLMAEIRARAERNERVLVTTLTKKMAEDLTEYFKNAGIRVRYMHSDVQTIERMEIIRDLRLGEFDVLVGINLLREGLDLPEVSLVAVLDADKEGFLRSETSLIQTIGRAARNAEGLVILYADTVTPSMRLAMDETARRRQIQDAYNQAHGIVPHTIVKDVREVLEISSTAEDRTIRARHHKKLSDREREEEIAKLEKQMREASKMLEFEYAAVLRDRIIELRGGKCAARICGAPHGGAARKRRQAVRRRRSLGLGRIHFGQAVSNERAPIWRCQMGSAGSVQDAGIRVRGGAAGPHHRAAGQEVSRPRAGLKGYAMKYDWLDAYLLSLPGAEKDYKLEWQWHRYMVRGKLFAAVCSPGTEHKVYGGHDLVNLKCDPRLAELYRAGYPEVLPGFYTDKRTWNAVLLDGSLDDETLRAMCRHSYELVTAKLPKYVQREIREKESMV